MSSVPILEEGRFVGAFAMFNDITAMKKMERQLLQQQKMEAIGTLAEDWARNFQGYFSKYFDFKRAAAGRLPSRRSILRRFEGD